MTAARKSKERIARLSLNTALQESARKMVAAFDAASRGEDPVVDALRAEGREPFRFDTDDLERLEALKLSDESVSLLTDAVSKFWLNDKSEAQFPELERRAESERCVRILEAHNRALKDFRAWQRGEGPRRFGREYAYHILGEELAALAARLDRSLPAVREAARRPRGGRRNKALRLLKARVVEILEPEKTPGLAEEVAEIVVRAATGSEPSDPLRVLRRR